MPGPVAVAVAVTLGPSGEARGDAQREAGLATEPRQLSTLPSLSRLPIGRRDRA